MRKIKLYSHPDYLLPGQKHAQILYPFWGKNPEKPGHPLSGRYDRYTEMGKQFFELVPLREADIAVFPAETGNWSELRDNALRFGTAAQAAGKPVALFFWSDSAEPLDVPNSIIFRTSFYRSLRRHGEFAMPAWSEDFVARYWNGTLPLRPKREKPIVGFCGNPGPVDFKAKVLASIGRAGRAVLRSCGPAKTRLALTERQIQEGPFRGLKPSTARANALMQLSRGSKKVKTNFIFKRDFWGGALKADGQLDCEVAQRARHDLVANMVDSDYVVCARGMGNFSYRFYETLCSGRIPVFINTDCALPYEDHLDWKKYCVWIEADEIGSMDERLAEFHARLSPDDFVALQHECRRLWLEWLSPEGFFSKLYLDFNVWANRAQA